MLSQPQSFVNPQLSVNSSSKNTLKKKLVLKWTMVALIIMVLVLSISVGSILLSKKPAPLPPKQYSLIFWGQSEDLATVQPILDSYHALNPTVTITYIKRSSTNYKENLDTRLQDANSQGLPDIVEVDSKWLSNEKTYLSSSPDLLPFDFNNKYYTSAQTDLERYMKNGSLGVYGIPLEFNGLVLFYNTKYIPDGATIPQDWPTFKSFASGLTKRTIEKQTGEVKVNFSGIPLGALSSVTYASDILQMLIMQNRIQFPDYSQDPSAFNSSSNIASAINFYKSFTSDTDSKTWDNALGDSISAFANEKTAMAFGYSTDIDAIKSINPNLHFKTTVPPVVAGQTFFSSNSSVIVAPLARSNSDQAWKFMQYYANDENLKKIFTTTNKSKKIYPSTTLLPSLQNDPLYSSFAKIAPAALSWRSPDWSKSTEFFKTIAIDNIQYDQQSVEQKIFDFNSLYTP